MTCEKFVHRLHELEDYLSGQLAPARSEEIASHLSTCPVCREAVESAALAGRLVRETVHPSTAFPEAFWTRVRAHLNAEEAVRRAGGDFWQTLERLAWRLSWAAAVFLVLLTGYAVTWGSWGQTPNQEVADSREIFQEPLESPQNQDDVLLTLASSANGR